MPGIPMPAIRVASILLSLLAPAPLPVAKAFLCPASLCPPLLAKVIAEVSRPRLPSTPIAEVSRPRPQTALPSDPRGFQKYPNLLTRYPLKTPGVLTEITDTSVYPLYIR
jgi:hypothetical protein